jgi:flagellar hook capping protein FlgD
MTVPGRRFKLLLSAMLTLIAVAGRVSTAAEDLTITGVVSSSEHFDPARGESVSLRFTVSRPVSVEVLWVDAANQIVKSHELKSSDSDPLHIVWDGRDSRGRAVPSEAYRYVIRAKSVDGGAATYDLADTLDAGLLPVQDIAWIPEEQVIRYQVGKLSRVRLRVGFAEGGPLLATVVNWAVRSPGLQREPWNGFDASGFLDLAKDTRREITAVAYELPPNTVLVGKAGSAVATTIDDAFATLQPTRAGSKRMYAFAAMPAQTLTDYAAVVRIDGKALDSKAPLVTVRGNVPVEVDVPAKDRALLVSRRMEPVLFVDGEYVFENEVGFIPMTWMWDTSRYAPGEHLVSVNLRGYEGNFGIATVKVKVER